jgi:hypothetical protein
MAGLDGDIVITGADEAVRDGYVGGVARVDAVGVAAGFACVDDDAPCGEAVAAAVRHVEIG